MNAHPIGMRAEELAAEFLVRFQTGGAYLDENIRALAELAVYGDETGVHAASEAIFGSLVEPLADSFDQAGVGLYNKFFAQIIQFARGVESELNRELERFALLTEDDVVHRAEGLRRTRLGGARLVESSPDSGPGLPAIGTVKRAIVLSRVTLGADVAVTSVIIERLKQVCPSAEVVLAGSRKTSELFGGDSRLGFASLEYSRGGTLLERLMGWIDLLHAIRELTAGLGDEEILIVDPDSRLTQLGLLPVANTGRYVFFPSREYSGEDGASLGELASDWSARVLGGRDTIKPTVNLAKPDLDLGLRIRGLIGPGSRPAVTVNFGVGENQKKRVGLDLEDSVVGSLIQKGAGVILDRGAGEEESARVQIVLERVSERSRGIKIAEIDEQSLDGLGSEAADIVVWNGRIGVLAGAIAASDLYIGYDSAGQHIAAALGIPCIDVFAGYSSPKMMERWRPTGIAEAGVIDGDNRSPAEVAIDVSSAVRRMLKV